MSEAQKVTEQNLLRFNQREDFADEKRQAEEALANPLVNDKSLARNAIQRIEKQLEAQAPPSLSPSDRENLAKRAEAIRQDLLEGMPSQEEMRKAPPGAVGKNLAWEERAKKPWGDSKVGRMQEWKNIQIALDPSNSDPDYTNFERFRPRTSTLGMDGAVIPGKQYFIPSEQYKANYDDIFKGNQADLAEKDAEIEALRAELAARESTPKAEKPLDMSLIAKCGKQGFKDKRGKMAHERFCKDCSGAEVN